SRSALLPPGVVSELRDTELLGGGWPRKAVSFRCRKDLRAFGRSVTPSTHRLLDGGLSGSPGLRLRALRTTGSTTLWFRSSSTAGFLGRLPPGGTRGWSRALLLLFGRYSGSRCGGHVALRLRRFA